MSMVDKFGEKVGEIAEKDPVKARKILLAGYRLQEKRLALFPDRKLPMSGQYVAKIVRDILDGAEGPKTDVVLLNAGAAIYLASDGITMKEGVEKAREIIKSGLAKKQLERFIEETNM